MRLTGPVSCVRGVLLGLAVCLCVAAPALSRAEAPTDPALLAELEALDALAAEVEDLTAVFEQSRHTPLLRRPIISSGTLRALPGRSRWDTDEPFASVMVIETDRLSVYYPEDGVLEVYPLEQRLGELAASPLARLADWLAHFTLERASAESLPESLRDAAGVGDADRPSVLVRLTPKDDDLAAMIPSIVVVLDASTGLSRAMAWSGQEGERTEVVFSGVRTDTGLVGEDLALDVPEQTRVVYPLGPVSPASEPAE